MVNRTLHSVSDDFRMRERNNLKQQAGVSDKDASGKCRYGATVSMPPNWPQVKSGLDPKCFTLRTVPALLKKSRAWADYDQAARSLKAAIGKLDR